MGDSDGTLRGVDVLSAGARRAVHVNLEVSGVDVHIHVLCLRQHRHRHGGGVHAAHGLSGRHALHPVHALLELQELVHANATLFAGKRGGGLAVSSLSGFGGGEHLEVPSLAGSDGPVHAHELNAKQCGLGAASAGPHFENDIPRREVAGLGARHACLLEADEHAEGVPFALLSCGECLCFHFPSFLELCRFGTPLLLAQLHHHRMALLQLLQPMLQLTICLCNTRQTR
mmetsp:Transcript_8687/g.36208  ORF Transcript_8687/g.36208 Transcript_8687/m.36208 type:complete len:229 (-) Transcript_8687:466-1152(-)